MTAGERQQVLADLQMLDDFASNTPLNRQWHAQWQARYQQVTAHVLSLGEPKEAEKPAPKPPPAPENETMTKGAKPPTGTEHLKGGNGK